MKPKEDIYSASNNYVTLYLYSRKSRYFLKTMPYRESKMSLDDVRKSLEQIMLFVGKQFVEVCEPTKEMRESNHRHKKYGHLASPRPHPLVSLWKKGYPNFLEFKQRRKKIESKFGTLHYSLDVSLSKELLELADIGSNLKEIMDIPWINEKEERIEVNIIQIWGERLKDPKDFEKAIYEIRVASSLKNAGYEVYFVKEGIKKTPDLLIERNGEKVYIECKEKDKKTHRDKRNENLWNEVLMSTLRFMDKMKKNYAIVVKAKSDLMKKDRDFLIESLQELIESSNSGVHRMGKFEIMLEELAEMNKSLCGPFSMNLEEFGVKMTEPTIHLYQHADVKFSKNMEVDHKNPRFMAFVSTLLPDRIKGILRSVDRAYKQIPKKGPGIIYIEINTGLYKGYQEINKDLEIIKNKMKGKLNLTKRVNAVVLTASSYIQGKGKAFYKVEINCFRNSSPIHPISKEFLDSICKLKIR